MELRSQLHRIARWLVPDVANCPILPVPLRNVQRVASIQPETRGERRREERRRIGLNQTDFGALGGVSKGSQILYEKDFAPSADYLALLAAHGVDILYILTGVRPPKVEPTPESGRALA